MIVAESVSKSYDGGKTYAAKDVSFVVEAGTVLALLGGSGSGKSTTIKMINRLIEPSSGRILVGGEDVLEQDPVLLRRRIGYVFQAIGLFPHMTVRENIAMVPKLLGQESEEYEERISELLDLVELPSSEYGSRYPSQLSGGQRQRVGFARAMAGNAKVMLLDEPFGALDPVTRDSLQTEFKSIQQKFSLTAVIVTHDMAEALLLADQIAVMKDGKVVRIGSPQELLNDPGDDYVAQLLSTPRRHGELMKSLEVEGEGACH
ncbi:MAG: ATP-binding cassette domain-containing protein [Planctomycetota bacterium]